MTSPTALTATMAPTVRPPCSLIEAVPIPPFIARAMPRGLTDRGTGTRPDGSLGGSIGGGSCGGPVPALRVGANARVVADGQVV